MKSIAELTRSSGLAPVDARVLLCATLQVNSAHLIAHADDAVPADQAAAFQALTTRRIAGEPVAYLVGQREFYGRQFAVSNAVLIPRPETELLVERALLCLPARAPCAVLDLGTGSGCIAISISLEHGAANVTATDQSAAALAVARHNAQTMGAGTVEFKQGNWFAALGSNTKFDLIVSNPPYVAIGDPHLSQGDLRFEPAQALAAANGGFAALQTIITGAGAHLHPGAWLLLEHGYDQAGRCREYLCDAGFAAVQSWRDLAGIERVSGGVFDGKP